MALYQVYRTYSAKERPDPKERYILYGWSHDKNVIKAFMKQRSHDKYKIVKTNADTMEGHDPRYQDIDDMMIDYIKLKFASTGEEMKLFTTRRESKEAEIRIQKYYHDLSSISDKNALLLFINLDPYYKEALELIGFRPKEIDMMFDCADEMDNYNTMALVENEILDAYEGMGESPCDDPDRFEYAPGLMTISQVSDKVLYSVENFITALREDL